VRNGAVSDFTKINKLQV